MLAAGGRAGAARGSTRQAPSSLSRLNLLRRAETCAREKQSAGEREERINTTGLRKRENRTARKCARAAEPNLRAAQRGRGLPSRPPSVRRSCSLSHSHPLPPGPVTLAGRGRRRSGRSGALLSRAGRGSGGGAAAILALALRVGGVGRRGAPGQGGGAGRGEGVAGERRAVGIDDLEREIAVWGSRRGEDVSCEQGMRGATWGERAQSV
jgi:hypothetical protein